MFVLNILCHNFCWVRIIQRVGYELVDSGYETSKPEYESSACERSMGTKRLDTELTTSRTVVRHLNQLSQPGGGKRKKVTRRR